MSNVLKMQVHSSNTICTVLKWMEYKTDEEMQRHTFIEGLQKYLWDLVGRQQPDYTTVYTVVNGNY